MAQEQVLPGVVSKGHIAETDNPLLEAPFFLRARLEGSLPALLDQRAIVERARVIA
ncbi:hypothetical protein [Mesorhizobium sp.]|uniref:hypothetical protein n=1 Tax=Mesorhizobium sp. TaxID=1871066 RepID=UPI0025C7338C|nr:hypothetical protein [Mesorhizobium sp.]